jgi:hypothetical protein
MRSCTFVITLPKGLGGRDGATAAGGPFMLPSLPLSLADGPELFLIRSILSTATAVFLTTLLAEEAQPAAKAFRLG